MGRLDRPRRQNCSQEARPARRHHAAGDHDQVGRRFGQRVRIARQSVEQRACPQGALPHPRRRHRRQGGFGSDAACRPTSLAMPTSPAWPPAKRPANCRKSSAAWPICSAPKFAIARRFARCWPIRSCWPPCRRRSSRAWCLFVLPRFQSHIRTIRSAAAGHHASAGRSVRRDSPFHLDLGAAGRPGDWRCHCFSVYQWRTALVGPGDA